MVLFGLISKPCFALTALIRSRRFWRHSSGLYCRIIHNTAVDCNFFRSLFQLTVNQFAIEIKKISRGWATLADATFYLLPVRKAVILFDSGFLLIVDIVVYAFVFVVSVEGLQHLKEICMSYSVESFLVINEA